MSRQIPRRRFLQSSALATTAAVIGLRPFTAAAKDAKPEYPPQRTITNGPNAHWFAYYDKLEFDPTSRLCLAMEVDFEHRSPKADDVVKMGMVDLEDGDKWYPFGESRSWGWQQGCMLQFIPGSKTKVLWNDRKPGEDHFVCHIYDIKSGERRTIPHPIYCLSPDGKTAFAADFRRINDMRPGYGYAGLPDPNKDDLAPKDSGIFRIDLESGKQETIVSLADVAKYPLPKEKPFFPPEDMPKSKHYFNHLLVNTDGSRLEFLHRWRPPTGKGWKTRMFTCAPDGSDLRCIANSGMVSHFIWRDPNHILAWARHPSHGDKFYVIEDKEGGSYEVVGPKKMPRDGHCMYLPNQEWILNDGYPRRDPKDKKRYAEVFLYHIPTDKKIVIGRYHHPKAYGGEWRVDHHPRFSPNGRFVAIDTPHTGTGRQIQLIDISEIVG